MPPRPRPFTSLRWRWSVWLTLTLIAVSALVQVGYYYRLQLDQAASWEQGMAEMERAFMAMTERSGLQLERLASQFVREVDELTGTHASDTRVTDLFTTIDSLQFLKPGGETLFAWEQEGSHALPPPRLTQRALASIARDDRPLAIISCQDHGQCMQHGFVPVLTDDGEALVIGASRPGGDAFVDFQQVSGADVVLLTDKAGRGGEHRPWGKKLALATHAEHMEQALDRLAGLTPLTGLYSGRTLWVGPRFLAVKAFDLPESATYDRITVLLLEDETASVLALRRAMLENLVLGALGMVLVGGMLVWMLGRAVRRLGILSEALPGLAENRFDQVRARIATQRDDPARGADEIDVLADAATSLADRLEQLNAEVGRHNETLQAQFDAIERERSFNELLLDTAPVVIVLHNFNNQIVHMNRFGLELTGWHQEGLCQLGVEQVIEPPERGDDPLKRLRAGDRHTYRVESALHCSHNAPRWVTWMHTVIDHEQGPLIMSVGLDMTLQRQTETRLNWLASHDAVTGLLSRESFAYEMQTLLDGAEGRLHTAALLVIDIDGFRDINDSYGPRNGDSVLAQVSRRLKALCPNATHMGRLGSDEFGILLQERGEEDARRLATKVEKDLEATPLRIDEYPLYVSVTTGIVLFPDHGEDAAELLANLMLALTQARRINPGHAHVFAFDAEVRALRRARMRIRDDVAEALVDDRFLLYYQPLFDLKGGRISHSEALVRMRAKDGSIVPPGVFIGVAESTGQIGAIQHVVLRKAIGMQAELASAGHNHGISINLAAKTFEDPTLLEQVRGELTQTGAEPGRLIFEIVESEAIASLATARQVAVELTELGARFAFDDFGVGFTSFEYLRELPVDIVKIDQSFIRHLRDKPSDRVLVRSMNDMIQRLGLKSVAEGVEDAWTFDFLRGIGVDYAQGYYVSRPVPEPLVDAAAAEVERRIEQETAELSQ